MRTARPRLELPINVAACILESLFKSFETWSKGFSYLRKKRWAVEFLDCFAAAPNRFEPMAYSWQSHFFKGRLISRFEYLLWLSPPVRNDGQRSSAEFAHS